MYDDVIKDLKQATKGSEYLDARVMAALAGSGAFAMQSPVNGAWTVQKPDSRGGHRSAFMGTMDKTGLEEIVSFFRQDRGPTQDVHAAMLLVPEGMCWRYDSALSYAEIMDLKQSPSFVAGSADDPTLGSHTASLALCIAALKARMVPRLSMAASAAADARGQ